MESLFVHACTAVLSAQTQQAAACDDIAALARELLYHIFLQIKFDLPKRLLKTLNPKHAVVEEKEQKQLKTKAEQWQDSL